MAEIDTSSYGHIVQPVAPLNPLQVMGTAAGLQNTLNQNRLFQQTYKTNLATSQIYKAAMNPDGSIDQAKLTNLLASNPDAAYGIGPVLEQSKTIQSQDIANNTAKYNLLKNHLTTLANYLGPLASGNPTVNDVAATIGHAITTGVATPQEAANFWATLPKDQQGNIDQTQIKQWALGNLQRVQDAAAQYGITNPAPTAVSTGGQTHLLVTPQNGPPRDVGQIANTLPPTAQVPQTVNGQPNTPTYLGGTSSQLQVPGGGGPAPQNPAPAAQPSPLAGTISGAPAAAAGAGNGPVQAGLAPGVADAAAVQAHASAQQGLVLQQTADQVPQMKAALGNLEGLLNAFTPGPGAQWSNQAGAFFNRAIQSMGGKGVATDTVSAQEEFQKLAVQLAQSQFAAIGGTGTDAKLDSAMHTSPSSALSAQGNKNIINLLKGNADAIAVKNREWQAYQQTHGPQSYGQFSTEFNKAYDPRVFQSVYMDGPERKKMIQGMSKNELAQFKQQYNAAVQRGWIPAPGQSSGG